MRRSLNIEEIGPESWRDIEMLLGLKGGCGGCWCMCWRAKSPAEFKQNKGAANKNIFKELVLTGQAHGALAYQEDKPVGYVSYGPRTDFKKIERSPSLSCDDSAEVWSVTCFFIAPNYRNTGIASALLDFAAKSVKKRNVAKVLEGYPAETHGKTWPAAFVWTGTVPLFKRLGFKRASKKTTGTVRMRKKL